MSSLQYRAFSIGDNQLDLYIYLDGKQRPWFRGKEVARFLVGNCDADKTIRKHVYDGNKMTWDLLRPEIIFVNEAGINELISCSTLQEKQLFRQWLVSEVLPEIYRSTSRKSYVMAELKQKDNIINECMKALKKKDEMLSDLLHIMKKKDEILLKIIQIK